MTLIEVNADIYCSVYLPVMPLYFFDVYNDDVTLDDEGAELVDAQAARARAIKEARVLAAETVSRGHFTGRHRIEIRDAGHNCIGSVSFAEAVDVRLDE